jgi:hypothetical protein
MQLARVEGRGTCSGCLGSFGCRCLVCIEIATAVDHKPGEHQEHGHEDHRHDEELAVLVEVSMSTGLSEYSDHAHETPPKGRIEPEDASELMNALVITV